MFPSPTSNPPPSPRAPGPDLLRAIAIVAVMLYHLSSHGIDIPGPGQHGWMGVDLFFVLSGYLTNRQVYAWLDDVAGELAT
jgi:peptidoglycan/LPS O-acetylase OafA/YrhL